MIYTMEGYKCIMKGLVYGGNGTGVVGVEVCVQFDTEDISWLKSKRLYRIHESKIHRVLNNKIMGKSAIRYLFDKKREATPEDVVELTLTKPVHRPLTWNISFPVIPTEDDDGDRAELCVEFESEEAWDYHDGAAFTHVESLIEDALAEKYNQPIKLSSGGTVTYPSQAFEGESIDLKLTRNH